MFRQQKSLPVANNLTCPDCQGRRFLFKSGKVECINCGWKHAGNASNKYGAQRTEYNGKKYDSKYEAAVARELDLRLKAKDILEVIAQYKVTMVAYRKDGSPALTVTHKVDFRIKHTDGSYELLEAKGVETDDYKWRRKFLEHVWLPEHPDHTYTVIKQSAGGYKR